MSRDTFNIGTSASPKLSLTVFYNYIITKIDRLVAQMEEASILLLDAIKRRKGGKV